MSETNAGYDWVDDLPHAVRTEAALLGASISLAVAGEIASEIRKGNSGIEPKPLTDSVSSALTLRKIAINPLFDERALAKAA